MGSSALGRGTALEENKVKASSGDTADFLDAKVDGDTMLVTADELVSVNEFFVGEFQRDVSLAGAQAITTVGFLPKAIYFMGGIQTTRGFSWGLGDGTNEWSVTDREPTGSDTYQHSVNLIIQVDVSSGNTATAVLTSFDVTGFTVTWSKNGSPTGTTRTGFIAFK